MLTLAHPWLLVLLPVPLLVGWWVPPYREARAALQASFLDRLARLTGRKPAPGAVERARPRAALLVIVAVWLCLVLALARPQRFEKPIVRNKPARDLLLAVDLSGSMDTADMKDASGRTIDRLAAVKQVLGEFLTKREGDRVGLIVFGSAPFVQVPFTDDLEVCRKLLDEAQVGMAGPRTMLGDAIGKAVQVFEESPLDEKVLILLSDGNDTGSLVPPVKAAELARDRGIVIHIIAVGDPTTTGEETFDEETLKAIAATTKGQYFRANNRRELEGIYTELERIIPRKVETVSYRPVTDLFHWPLSAALVLSLGYHLVTVVRGRRALWSKAQGGDVTGY
jgi:Ca-activated chloride channel family protein